MREANPANGKTPHSIEVVRPVAPPPGVEAYADLRPVLNALRAEITVLSRKVEQMQQPASSSIESVQAVERAAAAADAMPGRIANAVTEALRKQHRAILADLGMWRAQLVDDVRGVHEALPHQSDASDQAATVRAFDDRFEWLVDQLSERFVALGNELARIDRQLSARYGEDGAAANERLSAQATAPLLQEVERLSNALAGTIETLRNGANAPPRTQPAVVGWRSHRSR